MMWRSKTSKNAHVKDGVAMVRFQMALEDKMANGDPLTECDVADMLSALRREQPLSLGDSFDTIPAYGANAAMMHYHAVPETCAKLEPHGFLLVDSGDNIWMAPPTSRAPMRWVSRPKRKRPIIPGYSNAILTSPRSFSGGVHGRQPGHYCAQPSFGNMESTIAVAPATGGLCRRRP